MLGIVREDKEDNVAGGMGREEEEMRLESPGDGLCMPLWLQSPPAPTPPLLLGLLGVALCLPGAAWTSRGAHRRAGHQSHPFPSLFIWLPPPSHLLYLF